MAQNVNEIKNLIHSNGSSSKYKTGFSLLKFFFGI